MRYLIRHLWVFLVTLMCAISARATPPPTTGPSKVTIDPDGIFVVNGQRFFPIGIYLYQLNSDVMADLHEHRFNTVIGNGFGADQFNLLHEHGMMAVPFATDEFVAKAKDHPSLLAWYLHDEPEGSNKAVEAVKKAHDDLKKKDANHPIGLDHYLFEALTTYKDACDFTMTDVYPVTKNRDTPISHVGLFIDEARRIHGANWPHWAYIQDFGGPKTDGGKWAQPTGQEVRCMTFDAIVHRADGIMYFSYWPQAPQTWAAISEINRDLEMLVPWIVAKDGKEVPAKASSDAIHVRARKVGDGWMITAVNVQPKSFDVSIEPQGLGDVELRVPRENRTIKAGGGKFRDRFGPYDAKFYFVGAEP